MRRDLLEIGAPGRLLIQGEMDEVLPGDDYRQLAAANPLQGPGDTSLDRTIIEHREDTIVAKLLADSRVTVVVLGGGHDLRDNVPESVEYLRLETAAYYRFAGSGP